MDQLVDVARCQCLLFHYSYAPRYQRLHDCTQVTYTDACSKELSHIIGLLMHMQMVSCMSWLESDSTREVTCSGGGWKELLANAQVGYS